MFQFTPLGDSRGLFASAHTQSAFQVRENERGRDTPAFNYRIPEQPPLLVRRPQQQGN